MKRAGKILTATLMAAVMMSITACSSSNNKETSTEATTVEITTQAETTTTQAESTTAETTATALEAGIMESDGTFKAASGRYEIAPPIGWTLDEASDGEYATFYSQSGEDVLELTCVSGDAAEGMREVFPETVEEYKSMINRDGSMDIVKYEVKTDKDGGQTFHYAIKYKESADGINYTTISGKYDAVKKEYIAAAGTIMSSDSSMEEQVENAVSSLKIN